MVDTIRCTSYNTRERAGFDILYRNAKAESRRLLDEADKIESNEEYIRYMDDVVAKANDECHKAYMRCFAAQFHRCRNAWFADIVAQLEDGKEKIITERQYVSFKRYACDEDENTRKSGESYCRVGNCLVTLKWLGWGKSIKKESL